MTDEARIASQVRPAATGDAAAIARLLDDFNREYDDPTPGIAALTERLGLLLSTDSAAIVGAFTDDPEHLHGVSLLRFRPSIWSAGLECYLAELYVVPHRRGHGLGRAIMQASIALARDRGADAMDLGTGEDDRAARALYESLGFVNTERPGGPVAYFYEREL